MYQYNPFKKEKKNICIWEGKEKILYSIFTKYVKSRILLYTPVFSSCYIAYFQICF